MPSPFLEQFLKDFHEAYPGSTSLCFNRGLTENNLTSYEKALEKLKHISQDGKILDLACGDGQLLELLSQKYPHCELYGIDSSFAEIRKAHQRASTEKAHMTLGRGENLPYAQDFFELVTCHLALGVMPDVDSILKEISRVLKVDGEFVAILPDGHQDTAAYEAYKKVLEKYFSLEHKNYVSQMGDPRTLSEEGLIELFIQHPTLSGASIENFQIHFHLSPEEMADQFTKTYDAFVLTEKNRCAFKKELTAVFEKLKDDQGKIAHSIELRKLSTTKTKSLPLASKT